jgi:hypothetical protein
MSMLGELNELLNKIPLWKRLTTLPAEVDALAKNVAALEARIAGSGGAGLCPKCGQRTYKLEGSRPHPVFGDMGVSERAYKCSECNFSESKTVE